MLLLSHGNFCHGVKESYEMIAGRNDNILSLELGEEGIGVFSSKLREKLDDICKNEKVLVLTDIQGGTPYNEVLRYKLENPESIEIVSGMNLPMIIEVGINMDSELSCRELAEMAANLGRESILLTENI